LKTGNQAKEEKLREAGEVAGKNGMNKAIVVRNSGNIR
jgi:hypothetical protein